MKPRRLSLTAFGSYPSTLEIDFARLGRHGTFAITGPTGSGKSTIFDAMVYALYGDLPGFREGGNIRSQFAGPSTITEVTFEFESVGGELWTITRLPKQYYPRKRGDGDPVEKEGTVTLGRVGEDVAQLNRKNAVKTKIEELIGLTKEQFEQVVLIPQGQFEKVLKADTTERSELLRRLFPVEIFEAITEHLSGVTAERKKAYEAVAGSTDSVLEAVRAAVRSAVAESPDGLTSSLSEERIAVITSDDLAAILAEVDVLVEEARVRATKAKSARDAANLKLEATKALIERWDTWERQRVQAGTFEAESLRDDEAQKVLDQARDLAVLSEPLSQWTAARSASDEAERLRDALRRQIDALEPTEPEIEALGASTSAANLASRLASDAAKLRDEVRTFDVLMAKDAELAKESAALETLDADVVKKTADLAEFTGLQEKDQSTFNELGDAAAALERATIAQKDLQERQHRAIQRTAKAAEVDGLTKAVVTAKAAEDDARARQLATIARWRSGVAGRLALDLADGEACVVCGSPDHPVPARLDEASASDEELAAADKLAAQATEARSGAVAQLERESGILETMGPEVDPVAIADEVAQSQAVLAAAKAAVSKRDELVEVIAKRAAAIEDARTSLVEAEKTLAARRSVLTQSTKDHEEARIAFISSHGSLVSPVQAAERAEALAAVTEQFAGALSRIEREQIVLAQAAATLQPSLESLDLDDPSELKDHLVSPEDLERRQGAILDRRAARQKVLDDIAAFEADPAKPDERPEIESLVALLADADERNHDAAGNQRVIEDQRRVVADAPGRLAQGAEAIAEARRHLEEAKGLSDLCSGLGSAGASTRLSLENWVLMDFLRRVLVHANARLRTMTAERFTLEIQDEVADGRKAFGLDLAVFDATTGTSRPATTLSGGETFMAALSLALGLADVVSGGSNRTMGALFIDEGFGSLDPESLDSVLDVLRSLEDGGRIVGVISHVEELKASMPNGITLERTQAGSLATINYPED